jgi:transcriptional regulator with XRE-family HTH domain
LVYEQKETTMSPTTLFPLAKTSNPPPFAARDIMTFREKLRWLREREGMSQLELAKQLSASSTKVWQNRMSQLENPPKRGRENKIEPGLLMRIAEFFSVPVGWLIDPSLGLDDLHTRPSEYGQLSEVERQVLLNVRILGPRVALARLLGVTPGDQADVSLGTSPPPAVTSRAPESKVPEHDFLPTLGKDKPAKEKEIGNGGSKPGGRPEAKKPRRPKSRAGIAGNASLGTRMARTKKKLPGTSK